MILAGDRPSLSVMNESGSIISRPSRWASARATVVLPQPMKPTMTIRRSFITGSAGVPPASSFNHGLKQVKEFGKGDGNAIGTFDFEFSLRDQSGDAERHGDPVIA